MGLNLYKQTDNLIHSFIDKENDVKRLFLVILVTFLSGFNFSFWELNDPISLVSGPDPFHMGEAFVAAMAYVIRSHSPEFLQYTIHGAWDVLPTIISLTTFGENYFVFPTRVFISLCNIFSCLILVTISWKLILPNLGEKLKKFIFILIIASHAPLLVGIRDIFLLISIFLFLECIKCTKSIHRFILESFLGLSLAFGIFWSFDRGLVGIVSLGVVVLYYLLRYRRFGLTAFCGLLSIVILQLNDLFSIKLYVENFKFLASTSYMWSYGLDITFVYSIFAALFNISALICLITFSKFVLTNKLDRIALVVSIVTLSLLMLKIGTNRADFTHIPWSLWTPYLIFVVLHQYVNILEYKKSSFLRISYLFGLISLFLLFIVSGQILPLLMCIVLAGQEIVEFKLMRKLIITKIFYSRLIIATASIIIVYFLAIPILRINSVVGSINSTLKVASGNPPSNNSLVDQRILYAAQKLSLLKDECIFDLSNHGIFNAVLFLPPCTRFSYPVYADRSYEKTMISELQKSSPSSIIYSSDHWSYKIDKKSMVERLLDLNTWILNEYPIEECVPSYCIRRKNDRVGDAK